MDGRPTIKLYNVHVGLHVRVLRSSNRAVKSHQGSAHSQDICLGSRLVDSIVTLSAIVKYVKYAISSVLIRVMDYISDKRSFFLLK